MERIFKENQEINLEKWFKYKNISTGKYLGRKC